MLYDLGLELLMQLATPLLGEIGALFILGPQQPLGGKLLA